jgi:hypothetical protein
VVSPLASGSPHDLGYQYVEFCQGAVEPLMQAPIKFDLVVDMCHAKGTPPHDASSLITQPTGWSNDVGSWPDREIITAEIDVCYLR